MRYIGSTIIASALLVLAAACGGSDQTTRAPVASSVPQGQANATAGACSGPDGTPVEVVDFEYQPHSATVAVGASVTWTNSGEAPHTVTFDDGADCGELTPGASTSRVFDGQGTFFYHCEIHPQMRGEVVVQ